VGKVAIAWIDSVITVATMASMALLSGAASSLNLDLEMVFHQNQTLWMSKGFHRSYNEW
jgi:hypothetical protein